MEIRLKKTFDGKYVAVELRINDVTSDLGLRSRQEAGWFADELQENVDFLRKFVAEGEPQECK